MNEINEKTLTTIEQRQQCPHCEDMIPLGKNAREAHFFYKHDFTLDDPEYNDIDDDLKWPIYDKMTEKK